MVSSAPVVPPPGAPFAALGLPLGQQILMVKTMMSLWCPQHLVFAKREALLFLSSFLWA